MTNYKGDPTDLVNEKRSGLINYLFGKDRKKKISKEEFLKFQKDLMNDVFWIEFNRYSKDGKTISGADFCDHLLLRSNIASKQKRQMVSRCMFPTF